MKPPVPSDEMVRLEALRDYEILDTASERRFDDLAKLAAWGTGSPMAVVCMVDDRRQWFKATFGIALQQTPREDSFCAHTVCEPRRLLEVPDAALDARFFDNPLVTAEPRIRFYAGAPLVTAEGHAIGALCVLDVVPRTLTTEQRDTLASLAEQVMTLLDLRRALKELTRSHDALVTAREAATAASDAKSAFIAHVSHELRTPMTAILGYAELLRDTVAPSERDNVETICRNGQRLLGIVNDVLDLSKIEEGKFSVNRTHFAPRQVAEDVLSLMRGQADSKGIGLRLYADDAPPQVFTDPDKLRQIMLNLLANAIKFTERGHVEMHLAFDTNQKRLDIAVSDTGIGMSEAFIASLFRPFEQGDASVSARFGGTGLGLAICSRFVDMLGGEIRVKSIPGEGTVFRVSVDTCLEIDPKTLFSNPPSEPARTPTPSLGPVPRVLLVEDTPDLRRLMAAYLVELGMEVSTADEGCAAVRSMLARDFDIVFMDMRIPNMDGYEATATARAAGYRKPIVALTAAALSGDRERALAVGCDGYLAKPVTRSGLTNCVRQFVALPPSGPLGIVERQATLRPSKVSEFPSYNPRHY